VSKQDDHFFNTFSVVIGILVAVTIFLIAFARSIGNPREEEKIAADAVMNSQVATRTAPVGTVAIAGEDNSAIAIKSDDGVMPTALALPKNGEETYKAVCSACHAAGIAGAPKVGDKAAWGPRIAQGKTTLYAHAINGYKGKVGMMPAKGARADLPDDLVKETVDYIVKMNQ
jgi:cytochrome c5